MPVIEVNKCQLFFNEMYENKLCLIKSGMPIKNGSHIVVTCIAFLLSYFFVVFVAVFKTYNHAYHLLCILK
jgi:hypothetical protein